MNHIPGPAGEATELALASHTNDTSCFHHHVEVEPLKKTDVVKILRATPGIGGEVCLLLERRGDTFRASMTKGAAAEMGPLRPGDLLSIRMDVYPVVSKHYNPMRLVCFGTGACSRVGQLKDEEQLEEVSDGAPISFDRTKNEPVADANGNPSRQQHRRR